MLLSSEPTKKIDPRVRRTRNWIRQAFMELLAEKGLRAITVQDITVRAGINRATFYAHFTDKYDLLNFAVREAFREELERRVLNACRYSDENLRQLMLTVCEFVETHNRHCFNADQQFNALIEEQIRSQIYDLVMHWLSEGNLPLNSRATLEQVATVVSWAIYGLAYQRSRLKPLPSAETYVNQAFHLIAMLIAEQTTSTSASNN
ncbi:MAG: TetR/AcrR family transcriptional regulator [Thermanaerothrix sp.]|nr:TetR/AcrR family transcriptional regulator [Thermanaerothrix sp.]